MKYQEHPTWIMLENRKLQFKQMLNDLPRFHPLHSKIKNAHEKIVNLQYKLEDKLCRD